PFDCHFPFSPTRRASELMRDDPGSPAADPGGKMTGIVLGDRQLKMLKVAVIAMGVILVLGFITVIARIVYLVNRSNETTTAVSRSEEHTSALQSRENLVC